MTTNGNAPLDKNVDQKSQEQAQAKAKGARFLKAVTRAALIFAIVLCLLGGYLYFYAARQQVNLTARNLRALSSMSTQIGTSLQSADQILRQVDKDLTAGTPDWDAAAPFTPMYDNLVLQSWGKKFVGDRAGSCSFMNRGSLSADSVEHLAGWWHDTAKRPHCFYRHFGVSLRIDGRIKRDSALAVLNVAEYLRPAISRPVFHKTVLADDRGHVLLQHGLSDLVLTDLKTIIPRPGKDSAPGWNELRAKPSITEVTLAGEPYRLFMEPCCLSSDGLYSGRQLVVAGLVTKDALVRESLKISLSQVIACCAILILVFLGWPFLKLRLIGEREPVTMRDGMLVAAGSLLATALTTIFLLYLYSYTKFRIDRDEELRALSEEITTNLREEIAAAYNQLDQLANQALTDTLQKSPIRQLSKIRKDEQAFPLFESWSLIDSTGMQVRKWSTDSYVQPVIPIKDRSYFIELAQGLGWPGPPAPGAPLAAPVTAGSGKQYYLEPTVSRTTGKRQVALSIKLKDSMPTPVATMALEMVSLIGVVLPPGYGYAVLDSAGKTLLHSDPSRNLDERFVSETGGNRELVSAVMARVADTLNVKYAGADYRAHVRPVPGLPWSLVTFLDKQPGRINGAEWLGTSIYLTLIYAVILGIFAVLTLLFFPGYRAPWIWPDRRLYGGYLRLLWVNGLFIAAFLLALAYLEGDDLLAAGFVLPLQAMANAWACLIRHDRKPWASTFARWVVALGLMVFLAPALLQSPVAGWPHGLILLFAAAGSVLSLRPREWLRSYTEASPGPRPQPIERVYVAAATLFLLVTGVLPAAAFFTVSRSAHNEMLVKRGQLRMAKAVEERQRRVDYLYSDKFGTGKTEARKARLCWRDVTIQQRDLCELDLYYRFYFGTRVDPSSGPPDQSRAPSPVASSEHVRLFLVPYRPEASVEWRGMLPHTAHDSTWSWSSSGNRLEFNGSARAGTRKLAIASVLPQFWPVGSTEQVSAALLAAAVLILTWGIAKFLARKFFLIDVTDPVLISRKPRIMSLGGTNLFVVCRDDFDQLKVNYDGGHTLDLRKQKFESREELRQVLTDVGNKEPVVVRHFEYSYADEKLTKAKLRLLEALVYDSGSSVVILAEQDKDGAPLGLREAWRIASRQPVPADDSKPEQQAGFVSVLESLVLVDVRRWEEGWTDKDRRCTSSKSGSNPESESGSKAKAYLKSLRASMSVLASRLKSGLRSSRDSKTKSALKSKSGPNPSEVNSGIIDSESRCDPHLQKIWGGLRSSLASDPPERGRPTREELLDLLGERAEPYYRGIWESCQTGERVVLVHLAQHGLVNDKDRRVLRRLLARGLVRRRPHFTIMNETFRRYLLGHCVEVEAETPKGAQSPWDSVRRPVLAIVASVAILLFVTQQELFSATNALITAMATGVASFSRISGLFDSRKGGSSGA